MDTKTRDIITPEIAGTLPGLFKERVKRTPDNPAYKYFDHTDSTWKTLTWAETASEVGRWRTALQGEGLKPGERVAVGVCNCKEWVMLDQAALDLGLVVVPLFCTDRPENIAYILNEAEVKLLLLDDDKIWQRIKSVEEKPKDLLRVICLHMTFNVDADEKVRSLNDWLPAKGSERSLPVVKQDDPASIVFTSGTTGRPKGVILSHGNFLWNAYGGLQAETIYNEDLFLSFLPLSHTFERTIGYYLPIMSGAAVAHARSIELLSEDFLVVRPTALISVPRIFERVYGKIKIGLEAKPAIIRKLFDLATTVGWQRFEYQQKRETFQLSFLFWALLDAVIAKKLRGRFGGRLRVVVVGGAPLPTGVAKIFLGLGLPIIHGYGMTEAGPVVSVNLIHDNVPSSVGPPLYNVEAQIGEDDELLVKSPGVMQGYLNNPKATAETISSEGWLHTGDKAKIENGRIFITGRLKEIIVLANGEKVPPADIEMAIAMDPLIEQIMIVGEARPYLAALVVLDSEKGAKLDKSRIEEKLLEIISASLHAFPGYAQVRRVAVISEPWTIENEMMTTTMKLRRNHILEKHSDEIHKLYEGHDL